MSRSKRLPLAYPKWYDIGSDCRFSEWVSGIPICHLHAPKLDTTSVSTPFALASLLQLRSVASCHACVGTTKSIGVPKLHTPMLLLPTSFELKSHLQIIRAATCRPQVPRNHVVSRLPSWPSRYFPASGRPSSVAALECSTRTHARRGRGCHVHVATLGE